MAKMFANLGKWKFKNTNLRVKQYIIYSRVKNKWDYKGLEIFITRY